MRLQTLSILLLCTAGALAQSRIQPAITPNGVVNAGSYIAPGFANQGIARGSLFVIFGSNLGPETLVQANTLPLSGSDGLAGTRVRIDAGGYGGFALMVYTSAKQVAAILPSGAPEGDATLTLNYNNLTSNPVVIRIVRSAFGMFTQNQGGTGPAIAQNFVSAGQTPVNTPLAPASPGQTVILWGTGLGPVSGDEGAGALPGALPGLETLYVGGVPTTVRYAGRSGCCVAVDQVVFDVPAGVSGCSVPVAAVTDGLLSNFGTIAVAGAGSTCDDPLNFRATGLATLQRSGRLRLGQVEVLHESAPGMPNGSNTLTGTFQNFTLATLPMAAANPSAGTCAVTESLVVPSVATRPSPVDPLNAGAVLTSSGPGGSLEAAPMAPGKYLGSAGPAELFAGAYTLAGAGGADVGEFRAGYTVAAPGQWTNAADFTAATLLTGQPLSFRWTGADANGWVGIRVSAANTTLATSIACSAQVGVGAFTIPPYATRLLVQGEATVSVTFWGGAAAFTAQGLDVGSIIAGTSNIVRANFRTPATGQL